MLANKERMLEVIKSSAVLKVEGLFFENPPISLTPKGPKECYVESKPEGLLFSKVILTENKPKDRK